jgi:hypothetical protein
MLALTGIAMVVDLRAQTELSTNLPGSFEPQTDIYLGAGSFHSDLQAFNETMPRRIDRIDEILPALGLGFATVNRRFSFHSDLAFSMRKRSVFSDFEQIMFSRMRWSVAFGRHLYANEKLSLVITPMLGLSYDQYSLNYRNDSFDRPSSIDWVYRPQNTTMANQDQYPNHYVNPSLAALAQLRIMTTFGKRFSFSMLSSYQHDLGSGKWHYEYGFIRTNSPNTYTSGLYLGFSLGVLLKASDIE